MACILMACIVMAYRVMGYMVMAYVVIAHIVMIHIVMPYMVMSHIRARKYVTVAVACTCTMPIWRTTTCPKTMIATLWGVWSPAMQKNGSI